MDFRENVLNAFREVNAKPNEIVPMRNFRNGIIKQLNPIEKKAFIDEINVMIEEGLITYEDRSTGFECIRLTEKGFGVLYTCRPDYQIAEDVMCEFETRKYRVGEIIPMRYIKMNFLPSLNPVEQDRFEYVANKLIDFGFISYEDGKSKPIEGLVLQQRGFDYIYRKDTELSNLF